jgi:putative Holliday junction resolvase
MPDKSATVLGFDFGTYWIGVAVGQTLTRQATPLPAVRNKDWKSIAALIETWQPRHLVVGLPLGMDGNDQEMTARARRFGRQLQGRFGIETSMVDERLTTREAHQIAAEQGRYRSKPEIDSLAAALITESWLANNAGD